MKQKTISKTLKSLAIMIGVIGLLFFFVGIPYMVDYIIKWLPETEFLRYPALTGFGLIGIVCYYALFQFYTICQQIGYLNSFCKENVLALRNIGISAFGAGLLILLVSLYLLVVGYLHPTVMIISLFFIFVSVAFSIVCFSLSTLLSHAVSIKRENDLTI